MNNLNRHQQELLDIAVAMAVEGKLRWSQRVEGGGFDAPIGDAEIHVYKDKDSEAKVSIYQLTGNKPIYLTPLIEGRQANLIYEKAWESFDQSSILSKKLVEQLRVEIA